jgi:hypothetical protein
VTEDDQALAAWCRDCADDPVRFVEEGYPWGEPGPLEEHVGPDVWQRALLEKIGAAVRLRAFDGLHPVSPIRCATSSGHGVGKSTMVAWLVDWIMSTRPHCQGTITANTFTQLETKTWASIRRWTKLCVTGGWTPAGYSETRDWFIVGSTRMCHKSAPESWFCAPQSCREENSEAFAGQHAADSTSFYINDEDSAVPDAIHVVEEGGLTDGESMQFLFGNATRTTGAFHEACFGRRRDRYLVSIVDSRESRLTNKVQIAEWIQEYGEDSDFVRVRVRGLPPHTSDLQFIDSATVFAAQGRPAVALADDPLICGLDVARGGEDACVFRFRRGADARTIPAVRVTGERARDSMQIVSLAADILTRTYEGRTVAMMFVDATGGSLGGPIADRLRQLGYRHVIDVQFAGLSPDARIANMRAYMWSQMRDALRGTLAIDTTGTLETDLTGPGYDHDKRDRLVLESKASMKKRGVASPDDGDALALTFAQRVSAGLVEVVVPFVSQSVWA